LLFAIYLVKPSPFCILDEIDAPLDDANIDRFTRIIKDFSKNTQFIVVTHNKRTMEAAETLIWCNYAGGRDFEACKCKI
jgi:chromosome segregation protein